MQTKQWYYDRHQELWTWLSNNPDSSKQDWPGWRRFRRKYWQSCFACQYTMDLLKLTERPECDVCLVIWGNHPDMTCEEENEEYPTEYEQWANKVKTAINALKIANCKLR